MWHYETLTGKSDRTKESYSLCCQTGKIVLPMFSKPPPKLFMDLYNHMHPMSKNFLENIRQYNSIFSFTSMGGKVDKSSNNGRGPSIFRLQGQNCHRIGGLLPNQGSTPKFSQLYIYDTPNEVSNRINAIRFFFNHLFMQTS